MTTEIRTPFGAPTEAVELSGGLFRKQILRFDTINYTGRDGKKRKITFDQQYGRDLVEAFRNRAYDQVTFQIADRDNRHTNDPTRTGGEVVGVELTNDGVDAVLRLWGSGQAVIENNPKLGVSARILENLTKADGRQFPRALQHVLGTVDPQMDGMRPWEKVRSVELAGGSELLDLSNATYEGSAMSEQDDGTVTLELSVAQRDRILESGLLDEPGEDTAGDELDFDDFLAMLEGGEDEDEETEDDDEDEDGAVSLSNYDDDALELTNAQLATQEQRIIELTNALATSRVEAELDGYRREGLSPAVLEAAAPLLTIESGAVELSNGVGDAVDPGAQVRELLHTVVELSRSGHLFVDFDSEAGSLAGDSGQQSTRDALVQDWETNYG